MFGKIKYKNLITACIRQAASRNGIKIIEIDVQPEHVHCVVEVSFSISVSKVFQLLKGGSARLFFQFHEKAKLRYPKGHLWGRGKFASSVGFVQLDKVRDYVRNQSEHHNICSSYDWIYSSLGSYLEEVSFWELTDLGHTEVYVGADYREMFEAYKQSKSGLGL